MKEQSGSYDLFDEALAESFPASDAPAFMAAAAVVGGPAKPSRVKLNGTGNTKGPTESTWTSASEIHPADL